MLPNAENLPSLVPKGPVDKAIPILVGLEFPLPEVGIGLRACRMKRTPMPEAPIHKDGELLPMENEIRLSKDRLVPPPACDVHCPKDLNQRQLRVFVPTALDARHNLGTHSWCEDVLH